ncbi:LLM class F420-dependent oxidoreductase [Pseudonocardia sulfidoxydans NBRC 16205]|uniref:LLM class F420-dependent oxidoreductase n=2 Tax=Pseudonocardia sulfidoxydans TaxID=54011 RepID=A0A511DFT5_9PSEU|nr:TIGR03564 family F420-dependent LLM class oxidoreductase [Pseudonocardia sulfidoxydans]GEL23651.1 LLM class F420-dependent oxidoreductase [Pseudonocardia sulfidoxydans NBRC 16205]
MAGNVGITLTPPVSASTDPGNTVDDVVGRARAAAATGVGSAWIGQRPDLDATLLAAVVGREVPELTVGVSVVPIFTRHPLVTASAALTAQAATHGRFRLGLGLGAAFMTEPVYGVPHVRPVDRLREYLTVLRSVFAGDAVDHHGAELTAAASGVGTAGARPAVPLYVAAMAPRTLQVSGELADGILPYLAAPEVLAEHVVPALTAAADAAGRPRPRVVAFVPAAVVTDPDAARDAVTTSLTRYGAVPSYRRVLDLAGVDSAVELALLGDEQAVADGVRGYLDAGADEVVLSVLDGAEPDAAQRTWALAGEL